MYDCIFTRCAIYCRASSLNRLRRIVRRLFAVSHPFRIEALARWLRIDRVDLTGLVRQQDFGLLNDPKFFPRLLAKYGKGVVRFFRHVDSFLVHKLPSHKLSGPKQKLCIAQHYTVDLDKSLKITCKSHGAYLEGGSDEVSKVETEIFGVAGGKYLCVCAAQQIFAVLTQEMGNRNGEVLVRGARDFVRAARSAAVVVTCAACGKRQVRDIKDVG